MRRLISILLAMMLLAGILCGGAFASGEAGSVLTGSTEVTSDSTDTETILLEPVELDELIIGADGYEFTGNVYCTRVEVDPAAELVSQYPVIVFFEESDSVENGEIIGNVQFVSDYDEVIAVVHTNDVHGHIEVEPYVKGFADSLKASGDYSLVLTVSAGDIYGGGEAVAGAYNGEMIPAVVDRVYDVIVPGNNDYTIVGDVPQNLVLTALYEHTQTICSNVLTKETGLAVGDFVAAYEPVLNVPMFDELYEKVGTNEDGTIDLSALGIENLEPGINPYPDTTTFTTDNGTVVGLIGLTAMGGAMDLGLDKAGSIANAQRCSDKLREEGATVIVAIGHTGWLGEGETGTNTNDTNSWVVTNTVTGLDAFVDGHTHSIINKGQGLLEGEDHCFLNQAESFGYCVGVMYLYVKDGEVLAVDGDVYRNEDLTGMVEPDADIQALVDRCLAQVKEDFGKPVAHTDYFMNGERMSAGNEGGTVRGNETNLGDFFTDVLLAACSEKMGVDYDFLAYPGYWLRASIEPGDITMESIQGVFANNTVLFYQTYTAADVLSMVERGLSVVAPEAEGQAFTQYSGIRVTYIDNGGVGTPVTIEVGDTLVYDANNGGIQVGDDWTCEGVYTWTGGEIDSWNAANDNQPGENWICNDRVEVQNLAFNWLKDHTADDYTIYPNTVAPGNRIVEVDG